MDRMKRDFVFKIPVIALLLSIIAVSHTEPAKTLNSNVDEVSRGYIVTPYKPEPVIIKDLFKSQVNWQVQCLEIYNLIKEGKEWREIQQEVSSTVTFKEREGEYIREYRAEIDWEQSFFEGGDVYLLLRGEIPNGEAYMRITEDPVNVASLNQFPEQTKGKLTSFISYQFIDADPKVFVPFLHLINAQKAAWYSSEEHFFLYVSVINGGTILVFDRKRGQIVRTMDLREAIGAFEERENLEILMEHLMPEDVDIPQNVFIFTNGPEFSKLFGSYDPYTMSLFFAYEYEDPSTDFVKEPIKVRIANDPRKALENLEKHKPILQRPGGEPDVSFIFDEYYLDTTQPQVTEMVRDMKELLRMDPDKPTLPLNDQITQSQSNILIITAHRTMDFVNELEQLGKEGKLRGKYLVLFVCGEEYESDELVYKLLRNYHATGVLFYRSLIHLRSVSSVISKLQEDIQRSKEIVSKRIDEAVEDTIQKAINVTPSDLDIKRLSNSFKQYSLSHKTRLKEAA